MSTTPAFATDIGRASDLPAPASVRLQAGIQRVGAAAHALLLPAAVLALWWWAAQHRWMAPQILPAPATVWATGIELAQGDLWRQLGVSLRRLVLGLLAGTAGGVALGLWLGASRRAQAAVLPTFHAIAQIPTLVWLPLLMLWLGLGEALKLVIVFKAVLLPVTLHTLAGARDVSPPLREAARALRLPRRQWVTVLLLPSALPAFMTGLRLALAQGWASLLAVELLASSEGIGYLMVWGRQLFQLDVVFVCIVVIGALGALMDAAMHRAGRRAIRWPHHAAGALAPAGRRSGAALLPWALPAGLLALWAAAAGQDWIADDVLPGPLAALAALATGIADGTLPAAMAASLRRAGLGLAAGGGVGLSLGIVLALVPALDRLVTPTLSALRQVAAFAWVPLITAWAGLGEEGRIVFVALVAFFPLFIATHQGIAQLSPQLNELADALRLKSWTRLRLLVLPGAAPSIFAGLRLAVIYAWLGSIGTDYFFRSGPGIGSTMMNASQLFRVDQILACMLLTGLAGTLLGLAGNWLERFATRWRHQGSAGDATAGTAIPGFPKDIA
jgi:sulfonate transport system permease protein